MRKTFFSLFSFCLMNYPEWGRGIAQLYYRKFSDFVIFKHNVSKSSLKNYTDPLYFQENVTFRGQQVCVYDFPSLSLATRASVDVLELEKPQRVCKNCFF